MIIYRTGPEWTPTHTLTLVMDESEQEKLERRRKLLERREAVKCKECKVRMNILKGWIEHMEKTKKNGNKCKTPREFIGKLLVQLIFHMGIEHKDMFQCGDCGMKMNCMYEIEEAAKGNNIEISEAAGEDNDEENETGEMG